ncbi:MAG TPA: tryptophan--tRNA ligase, partial [Candidatus Acidoferrum sp.]|nr:tryptophan--tRNA ligase [Candidatus Acidoferrum sp.]
MKKILLTGDTPTGKLHLGHLVGSIENRVRLQDEYDCYFIIANKHAFTTNAANPAAIRDSVMQVATDWLAAGIDPRKSAMFVQSEVPAIDELTFFFSMLLPLNRVLRNPTLKSELRDKNLGDNYAFGFPLYAVGQVADILSFRADIVPVGEDQLAHLEMTREVVRRFNQLYCGVDPETPDDDQVALGGLFPMVKPLLGRVKRLVGIGAPGPDGQLFKMSKSLDNAIYLSDPPDEVARKVKSMYTDPNRIRATDPGTVENNPLWIFHDAFNSDVPWLEEHKDLYRRGQVGDKQIKERLTDVLNELLDPIRARRAEFERNPEYVLDALRSGTARAIETTEVTVALAK